MSLVLLSLLALLDDPKPAPVKPLDWLPSLAQGYVQAQQRQQPVLLKVGGEGCVWCGKLEAEIAKPEVQKELAKWTLVVQDISQHEKELKPFGVQGIPALRIVNAYGRIIASQDGYLPADKLIDWLKKHQELAAQDISKELVEEEELTLPIVLKLLKTFPQRDSMFREAAIRRLLPNPEIAAIQVVEALSIGNLQARLASLELLAAWKAPILEIDPWQPESLNAQRLKDLQEWARAPKKNAETIKELAADQLQSARLELQQLFDADDAQAMAINERLARYGKALLPEVYAQLKKVASDQQRERLTLLRYRLVSRDALALRWPNGLQRLAATSAATRHKAVQELAQRATPAEEPLLLELFSDPDALVREISLRTLHAVAGSKVTASLVNLLNDPEPNVRAAVLKQLAEKPSAELIPSIREYIAKEKDQDLVVHAVRVLRNAKGKKAAEALRSLFTHESWRVRAEAAEGIGELHKDHHQRLSSEEQAENYTALIELLKDTDDFVISRATTTLKSANLATVVEPLLETARTHPNLAPDILTGLAHNGLLRGKSIEAVRKFCTDQREPIRSAAIMALIETHFDDSEKEIKAALKDTSPIRTATCKAVKEVLTSRALNKGRPYNEGATEVNSDDFVAKLRKVDTQPKWLSDSTEQITQLLKDASGEEKLATALLLLAMGKEEPALATIQQMVKDKPALVHDASSALVCLPWEKKLAMFKEFINLSTQADQLEDVLRHFSTINDPKMLPVLWEFFGSPKCTNQIAAHMHYTLLPLYFGSAYYSPETITEKKRKAVIEAIRPFAEKGPEPRQGLAIALCFYANPEVAGEIADKLKKDKATSPELRNDAAVVYLMSLSKAKAREHALELMKQTDPAFRRIGMEYLTLGSSAISYIRNQQISLSSSMGFERYEAFARASGQAITVEPPKGITEDMVRPLLKDAEPRTAAMAGYLLCTMGKREGLPALMKYWREHGRTDDDWQRLVYRAVAAAGIDEDIAQIEEIYRLQRSSDNEHYVSELYWTIRGMEGPNALRLRKTIRQEIGMDRLR